MAEIKFSIPDESLAALELSPQEFADELRLAAAIKLYELNRLSSGAAARMAGVPKPVFLSKLGAYGAVTFDLTEDELREDVRNA
jgi:predicted HTH domain antitoxin